MYLSKKTKIKQGMFIRHIMAKTVYKEENMFLNFNYILSDLSPVYSIQPVVKPVWQPIWQPVGCLFTRYSRLSNRLYSRFDNRLYRVNGVLQ